MGTLFDSLSRRKFKDTVALLSRHFFPCTIVVRYPCHALCSRRNALHDTEPVRHTVCVYPTHPTLQSVHHSGIFGTHPLVWENTTMTQYIEFHDTTEAIGLYDAVAGVIHLYAVGANDRHVMVDSVDKAESVYLDFVAEIGNPAWSESE